ncbi:MAG: FG-GAP repeat protein [Planctomycetes bacterium]|nr:FG-GAP repeat protein [Planctomycetota bacterium]
MNRCPTPLARLARVLPLALAPALAPSLAAQQELFSITGRTQSERFGESLASLRDLDGDGVGELLIGAPDAPPFLSDAHARVVSGATLTTLVELSGGRFENFGAAVADGGDIDGDGTGDWLVGAPAVQAARAFSGRDGSLLREWSVPDPFSAFGASVAGVGDVDGDGFGDVAIGAPYELARGEQRGVVRVLSGRDGHVIQSFEGPNRAARLGDRDRLANVGDVDGDGHADLALLAFELSPTFAGETARLVSAASGAELLLVRFDGGNRLGYHGTSIDATADRDGDGRAELLIGTRDGGGVLPGRALVLSSATGAELLVVDGPEIAQELLARDSGDRDGDGLAEVVLSIRFDRFGQPQFSISLHAGSDGALLDSITGATATATGRALRCDLDVDGDGLRDVTLADPAWVDDGLAVGVVEQRTWPGGRLLARQPGAGEDLLLGDAIAALDDLDGDGANDFAVANVARSGPPRFSVRLLSGRDGASLADHRLGGRPDGALATLPDVDGDGHDDYAIGLDTSIAAARVEVRSSADGRLLQSFAGTGTVDRFGATLAVGVQSSGAIHLAIGALGSNLGSTGGGAVWVFDVASGVQQFRKTGTWLAEGLGSSIAFLGDVNGEGTGDWALGGPGHGGAGKEAGRVLVVSGKAGGTLVSLPGGAGGDHFGGRVAALRDLDGDAIDELAVAARDEYASEEGAVTVLAGGKWSVLSKSDGSAPNDRFGSELVALRDLNGDGADEWAALASAPPRFELRDGAAGHLLARVAVTGTAAFQRLAGAVRWQRGSPSGDAIADLLAIDPADPSLHGRAWLVALDDLLLQFEPPIARAGDTVFAWLRGGPSGNAAGLLLLDVNGVPVVQWIGLGRFDTQGHHFACADVGPGLAGTTLTVQGFAIGFDGRLKASAAQVLTFE